MRHIRDNRGPLVSVIVPFYNARNTLRKLLPSLIDQNFRKDKYEILLVDDGSTDNSSREIRKEYKDIPVCIRVLRQEHKGCYSARNFAAKKARGTILAFIDSDEVADKNWLKFLTKDLLRNKKLSIACGRVDTDKNTSLLFPLKTAPIDAVGLMAGGMQYATCNIAYKKEAFEKLGGFDERFDPLLRGDSDLGLQANRKKLVAAYEPRARVYHPIKELSVRGLFRLAKYRFHDVLLYKKYKKLSKNSYGGKLFQPVIGPLSPTGLIFIFLIAALSFLFYVSPSWLLSPSSFSFLPWLKSLPWLTSLPRLLLMILSALLVWVIFFCFVGYRLLSRSPHKPSYSLRLKSCLVIPVYSFAVFVARLYGCFKYRRIML